MYNQYNTALGGINTTSQISGGAHNALKFAPPVAAARGAFLALLKLNVFGLAKLISKKAFLVDAATTAKQTAPNMWWDVGARFRNGWFNLGGDWDKFVAAVNAGKNKKALGLKLAPAGIKAKLKAQGIGSNTALGAMEEQGIGVTLEAGIAAASTILIALKPILEDLFSGAKTDLDSADLSEFDINTGGGSGTNTNTGTNTNSGKSTGGNDGAVSNTPLLIGAAAVAAFFLMSKK